MSGAKRLNELLGSIGVEINDATEIAGLAIDSRKVSPGCLFFAYPGANTDGRDFIGAAIDQGAAAIIYEPAGFEALDRMGVPAIAVSGVLRKIGVIASAFYDHPSSELQVFGVTGTNGKTTCAYLLAQAFKALGMQSAFVGTIGYGQVDALSASTHTTPDPITLQQHLREWVDAGVTQVSMEVSSHALHQGRVAGVSFYGVGFTNLTQDHLDYHATMDDYGAAKAKLFNEFDSKLAVINAGDAFGQTLIEDAVAEYVVSYAGSGDLVAEDVRPSEGGLTVDVASESVELSLQSQLVGRVNVENLLLLTAMLLGLSVSLDEIERIFPELKPAPGRMELYPLSSGVNLVIDYAHTPDALTHALESVREHCEGQLWVVFGCGGDRDQSKRPLMGAASELADHVVVTNDNPRSEAPEAIAEAILQGMASPEHALVVLDRAEAIRKAVKEAQAGDWVLVAGKGHESTQTLKDRTIEFSDRVFAASLQEASDAAG